MNRGISHMGLMHLVGTNLIIWFRIILKESIIHYSHYKLVQNGTESKQSTLNKFRQLPVGKGGIKLVEETRKDCSEAYHNNDYVEEILTDASPFLLCFIIEFALIGATVFWNTWNNVHNLTQDEVNEINRISLRKPQLCATIKKTNWSHSKKGTLCGFIIFLLTIFEIFIFYILKDHEFVKGHETFLEYSGKVVFTILNTFGFFATIFGILQIQWLPDKRKEEIEGGGGMDLSLLKIGACFIFIYNCLTLTIGVIGELSVKTDEKKVTDHGRAIHLTSGIVEIMAVISQTILIHLLSEKVRKQIVL